MEDIERERERARESKKGETSYRYFFSRIGLYNSARLFTQQKKYDEAKKRFDQALKVTKKKRKKKYHSSLFFRSARRCTVRNTCSRRRSRRKRT
jgi:hypothetical protein